MVFVGNEATSNFSEEMDSSSVWEAQQNHVWPFSPHCDLISTDYV